MEITPQEKDLIFIYRDIKNWGFGEINIKFSDNELTNIKASKNYKPKTEELLLIQAEISLVEKIV